MRGKPGQPRGLSLVLWERAWGQQCKELHLEDQGRPNSRCSEPPIDTRVALNCNFCSQKENVRFGQARPPRWPSKVGVRPPQALSGHRPAMLFQGPILEDSRWEHGQRPFSQDVQGPQTGCS